MKDYEQAFKVWLESRDTAAKSVRAYLSDLRQFTNWFEQATSEVFSPSEVDWRDMQEWRNAAAKSFKPATVNRRISSLKSFFTCANEQGWVTSDPTKRLKGVEQQVLTPKALADEDLRRIMRKARKSSLRDCTASSTTRIITPAIPMLIKAGRMLAAAYNSQSSPFTK